MAKKKLCTALDAATIIKKSAALEDHGKPLMVCHCGDFYKYSKGVWNPVSEEDLKLRIMRQIQTSKLFQHLATASGLKNVQLNLASLLQTPTNLASPSKLDDTNEKILFLNLQNGLLDLKKLLDNDERDLLPHDSNYFITTQLPVAFDPDKKPTEFLKVMKEILPNEVDRNALQEFVGICLLPSCEFQKILILEGEGANGKSVVICIIRCLLGLANISGVALQAMNPARTFPMWAMVDKLANIDEDLSEMDQSAEAILKKIASGDLLNIERKYKDAVDVILLAKLIFCANSFPRINDKSDGFWRRLLIIYFTQKFEENNRRTELKTPDYWINSGELPGVLNWALDGLKRLSDRGYFIEPKSSIDTKQAFREESNPAMIFLRDHVAEAKGITTSVAELYEHYRKWANQLGFSPLAVTKFSREVQKKFPLVQVSEHPITFCRETTGPLGFSIDVKYRSRGWIGLRFIQVEQG